MGLFLLTVSCYLVFTVCIALIQSELDSIEAIENSVNNNEKRELK